MVSTTRIRNGTIQTPTGPVEADVFIEGERISALLARESAVIADSDIDAAGLWVLPGLIDLHTHTRVPGYEYKEDFTTSSQAAAAGGYTTYVDMPNVEPPTTTVELFEEKRAIAAETCLIDWGHFVGPVQFDQIEGFAKAGATGFKIFQVTGGYPHDPRLALDDPGRLYQTFQAIADTGLPCVVHPFAQTLFEYLYEEASAAGAPRDIHTFSAVYTRDIVWRTAVAILLELQRDTQVRLQVVHTHAPGSLRMLRQAKKDGLGVTVAADPKYFHLTEAEIKAQGARAIPGGAVTSDSARMEEIWRSIDDGTIDIIDSDHAPHTLEDLELMEKDPLIGPFGAPHLTFMLPLLLTDVRKGNMRLERLVQMLTESPAKIIGVYPEKGAVLPGSSADIVLVDPEKKVVPRDEDVLSKSGWTPYVGWELTGVPVLTMLRGTVIAKDGAVLGEPGNGRYIAGRAQDWAPPTPQVHQGLSLKLR